MTYLDLINLFWDSATINPLSTGQVSLYFALLHVCNRSYWTEWFSVPNQMLSVLTGLSRTGIQKARNELKQRGFIDFEERGNKATAYKIVSDSGQQGGRVSDSGQQSGRQSGQQSGRQSGQQSGQQSGRVSDSGQQSGRQSGQQSGRQSGQQSGQQSGRPIINILNNNILKDKRQKTEDKEKDIPPISPIKRFEDFLNAFPNKQRRYLAEQAYCKLILSGMITEEELVSAAQNYAKQVEDSNSKIYLPNNFLENHVYEDYLELKGSGETEKPEENQEPEEELVGDDWLDLEV